MKLLLPRETSVFSSQTLLLQAKRARLAVGLADLYTVTLARQCSGAAETGCRLAAGLERQKNKLTETRWVRVKTGRIMRKHRMGLDYREGSAGTLTERR